MNTVLPAYPILAATGHRPAKLGGYTTEATDKLFNFAVDCLLSEPYPLSGKVITGMALGWDTAIAEAALAYNVELICAIPFIGQESRWQQSQQRHYDEILSQAAEVIVITSGGFSPEAMQLRNKWMVDHCDRLLSLWDGSAGGTANCNKYAKKVGRETVQLWPKWSLF